MKRTDKQNRSLHKFCEMVSKELNDRGLTVQKALSSYKVELDWNQRREKENIWRPSQEALTAKESTTDADTVEYIEIYEHINRWLSQQGVHVPWPDRHSMAQERKA